MSSSQDSTASQKTLFSRYKEHITGAIFAGLVLGILTGLFLAGRFPAVLTVTQLLGSVYMNALNMMIFPLVFCSIVVGITSIGNAKTTDTILSLATQLVILYIAFFGFAAVVYGGAVKFLGKESPIRFVKACLPAALNAFGTCSSSATIPISKQRMEEEMGVSDKITSIAIPLGATVNMDAVSILMSFMIVFFANACGVEVSTSMMVVILLANVILSVGTPGIPGGAIASFAALATMAGLPAGVMGVYISINTLCDMGATCVNVIGDMAGCVVLKEKIKLEE